MYVYVSVGGDDADRGRLTNENERLRSALKQAEAMMKQTKDDAVTSVALMQTRCQVLVLVLVTPPPIGSGTL